MSNIPTDHHQYNSEEKDQYGIDMLYEYERGKAERDAEIIAMIDEMIKGLDGGNLSQFEIEEHSHKADILKELKTRIGGDSDG